MAKFTHQEARKYVANYKKPDPYLNASMLRVIVKAMPTKAEALAFLVKVQQDAAFNSDDPIFGANYKRQRRNALKIRNELTDVATLF